MAWLSRPWMCAQELCISLMGRSARHTALLHLKPLPNPICSGAGPAGVTRWWGWAARNVGLIVGRLWAWVVPRSPRLKYGFVVANFHLVLQRQVQ